MQCGHQYEWKKKNKEKIQAFKSKLNLVTNTTFCIFTKTFQQSGSRSRLMPWTNHVEKSQKYLFPIFISFYRNKQVVKILKQIKAYRYNNF